MNLQQLRQATKKLIKKAYPNYFFVDITFKSDDLKTYEVEKSWFMCTERVIKEIFGKNFKELKLKLNLNKKDTWAEIFMISQAKIAEARDKRNGAKQWAQKTLETNKVNDDALRAFADKKRDSIALDVKSVNYTVEEGIYRDCYTFTKHVGRKTVKVYYGSRGFVSGIHPEVMVSRWKNLLGKFRVEVGHPGGVWTVICKESTLDVVLEYLESV